MNYILIKTIDDRKFLTHEKNFDLLVEFAKTFSAKMYLVKSKSSYVLQLKKLASALCNMNYKEEIGDFEIIKQKFPIKHRMRSKTLKNANEIRNFIKKKFIAKETVSLKELKKKFKKYQLTLACLLNHVKYVAIELGNVTKMGRGLYQAV
jgi:hypothetical protein